jgi:hypothetical protein
MPSFFVNRNPQITGDHDVHRLGCSQLPSHSTRQFLGEFLTCHIAIAEAKRFYPRSSGCNICLPECYTN